MLSVNNISTGYDGLKVLFDVSLKLELGEVVALVGSNGVGKTTLLRSISGLLPLTSGNIEWFGKDISNIRDYKRAELGIVHIPQGRGILSTLSVYDNLMLGGFIKRTRKNRGQNLEKVLTIYPKLKERINQIAGTLSGGEQQMLANGRALMMEPKLLMLDEPSLGLAPIVVEEVYRTLLDLKKEKISMLIIEQNLSQALNIADRGYVLETGKIVIEGTSEKIKKDEYIKKAYLGI